MEETEEWLLWNLWMKQTLSFLLWVKNKIPSTQMDGLTMLVGGLTTANNCCDCTLLQRGPVTSTVTTTRLSVLAGPLPFSLRASNFLHLSSTSCFSLPSYPDTVHPPVLHSVLPNFTCQTSSFFAIAFSEELPHRDLLILGRLYTAKMSVIFSTSNFPVETKMH